MSKIVLEFSKVYLFTCVFQYKSNFESSRGLWWEIGDNDLFKDFLGELAAKLIPPSPLVKISKIGLEFSKVYFFTSFFQYKSDFESCWGLWGEIGDNSLFEDFLGELAAKMTPPLVKIGKIGLEFSKMYVFTSFFQYKWNFESG